MSIQTYKTEIEEFIIQNKIDQALKRLREILKDGELKNEVISHHGSLNKIKNEERKGVIDGSQAYNKLKNTILDIKSNLEKTDLRSDIELLEGRFERLFIITKRKEYFSKLFNAHYFHHVTYLNYEEAINENPDGIDIYVFDYHENQEDLLKTLLLSKKHPPILLLVNKQLRWLFDEVYTDRFYPANSIYSLYARLEEMLMVKKWMGKNFGKKV